MASVIQSGESLENQCSLALCPGWLESPKQGLHLTHVCVLSAQLRVNGPHCILSRLGHWVPEGAGTAFYSSLPHARPRREAAWLSSGSNLENGVGPKRCVQECADTEIHSASYCGQLPGPPHSDPVRLPWLPTPFLTWLHCFWPFWPALLSMNLIKLRTLSLGKS